MGRILEARLESLVLMILVFTALGVLLGWACWIAAKRLTEGAPVGSVERALPILAVILGGGVLSIAGIRSHGDIAAGAVVAMLTSPLLITLLTDLRTHMVFPVVLLPGLLVGLAIAATEPDGLVGAVISSAAAAAITAVLVFLSHVLVSGAEESPLGTGDIFVTAAIGAILGPDDTPLVLFGGMVLAAVVAGFLLLTRRARRHDVIPYGAFLCGSALVALAVSVPR